MRIPSRIARLTCFLQHLALLVLLLLQNPLLLTEPNANTANTANTAHGTRAGAPTAPHEIE